MEPTQIAELLCPFLDRPLAAGPVAQISTYIDLLLRWNARMNLSAIRDPESIVTRHFGESLFLARHVLPEAETGSIPVSSQSEIRKSETSVLDLGSGAGFPGLPLKIWAPDIRLTLVESNHKKTAFLREAARALRLTDVNVKTERARDLSSSPGFTPADVVTLRAVERFEDILPIAVKLVAPGGRVALLIGASQISAIAALAPEIDWLSPIPIPSSSSRVLQMGSKR